VTADIPIDVDHPRTEDFRTSALYNERCRLVSAALRRAMGAGDSLP
jgi:NitT/TauT family transport system ATP-binding protein